MALAAIASPATDAAALLADLAIARKQLDDARPTAVNLSWATGRIYELASLLTESSIAFDKYRSILLNEAQELADDDVRINKRLGDFGATLIKPNSNLVHHCNTGALATVDYGTAIGVIYSAHHQKKNIHVWVDETRPRLQGSRLTAWELMREGVPIHLIADNASGLLMYQNKVDAVVFGADRVAANGDTANKIGTYKLVRGNTPTRDRPTLCFNAVLSLDPIFPLCFFRAGCGCCGEQRACLRVRSDLDDRSDDSRRSRHCDRGARQ